MTQSSFESSLAALRDNVVMAMERREMGVVEDGLAVYQKLVEALLDEQLRLQEVTTPDRPQTLPLGREWERILRDLYGIVDGVSANPSRLLWIDTLSWIKRIADSCADRGILNALGGVLTLFESAWNQELASPGLDAKARQDIFLMRLSDFGMLRKVRSRENSETGRAIEIVYTRAFLHVVKRSIESGDVDLAKVSIKYFLRGGKEFGDTETSVADAGLLAIYAWILYRFDHDEQPDVFATVLQQISGALESTRSYLGALRVSDELENELGIHWWELRERGPSSFGTIQIGSYVSLALILVANVRLQVELFDPDSDDDVSLARRLLSVIEAIQTGGFAKALSAVGVAPESMNELDAHLNAIIESGDLIEERSYSRLPVDPERVNTFRRAVAEKIVRERTESLAAALRTDRSVQGNVPDANFGLDSLIPRWYFAETRVFAEPERLAEDLVRSLGRGEENRILDLAVGDVADIAETPIEDLVEQIDGAISEGAQSRWVVATNSYQAHALLVGREDSDRAPSEGLANDAQVIRVYDDRLPYVALLSPDGMPRVHVAAPLPEIDGDETLDDGLVIVGVSELSDSELDDIVGTRERTKLEEARLRGSLRVRLLEYLEIELEGPTSPHVWRLAQGTW